MKKPIIILLFFYAITLGIEACCTDDRIDFCSSIDSTHIDVYDNSGEEPVAISGSVKATDVMFRLNIEYTDNVCKTKRGFSFISKAYAYTCETFDRYYINDTVKNIIISADKPYSSLHPAGTGLNEFFDMPKPIDYNDRSGPNSEYDIKGLEPPAKAGVYTYKVQLLMKSGKVYEATTQPVNITL